MRFDETWCFTWLGFQVRVQLNSYGADILYLSADDLQAPKHPLLHLKVQENGLRP